MTHTTLIPHSDLIEEIENYCDRHQIPLTTFGMNAVHDPNLVADLRGGRELRRKTMERIRSALKRRMTK